jgi:hypothetical protein
MKRLTRRDLPAIITGAAIALRTPVQAQTAPDLEGKARESKRAAAAELSRVELPMSIEPAFHFKA